MMYRNLLFAALVSLAACSESETPLAPGGIAAGVAELAKAGPPVGRIVFSSLRNNNQADIYLMNADGTGVVQLTSSPDKEFGAAWSFDNQRIAFTRPRVDASNVVHSDIFVMDADGTNGHFVSPTPNSVDLFDPAWSPDGSRIVVWTGLQELAFLDVATGAFSLTQPVLSGRNPSFDPTGTKLIWGGGLSVNVRNADGTGQTLQIEIPDNTTAQYPTFSPDGLNIAFAARDAVTGRADIYLVGATGGLFTRLTGSPSADDTKPSWSPDGKQIAFTSDRGGTYQIYRMNVSGGGRTRLSSSGATEVNPAYTH
jgi:Tol biopolymer transport system component